MYTTCSFFTTDLIKVINSIFVFIFSSFEEQQLISNGITKEMRTSQIN